MLDDAIADLKNRPTINIKGKEYTTVATRVEVFRKHFPPPEWGLDTNILSIADNLVRVQAHILHNGSKVASGLAEENRTQGPVNRTSAVENCETSAIGRALAAFGLHGGEYASGDEVSGAIAQQQSGDQSLVKTNLKKQSHEMVRELHACTDMDMLGAYWISIADQLKNMKSHYPEGYDAVIATKDKMKDELVSSDERNAIQEES